jgi:hypothetical protein
MRDLHSSHTLSIFKVICSAAALARMFPIFDLSCKENVATVVELVICVSTDPFLCFPEGTHDCTIILSCLVSCPTPYCHLCNGKAGGRNIQLSSRPGATVAGGKCGNIFERLRTPLTDGDCDKAAQFVEVNLRNPASG